MDLIPLIRDLSAIPGPSGHEDAVRQAIIQQVEGHCDYHTDSLGNLIAFKKGAKAPKNKLLLSAHMDEVGFVITYVEPGGLLRFSTLGGIDSRVIIGKSVLIGPKGIPGVIGAKAVHQQTNEEKDKVIPVEKLYIDIGAKDEEEALSYVQPGEFAIFESEFAMLGESKIMGRAFDDRAGCALLISLIRGDLPYDCYFSFTVQEETGCTGAQTVGYQVAPDIAIAVETTTASDIPGIPADKRVCTLGKGPVVSFMDKGTVYDHKLYRFALDIAAARNIPCQPKLGVYGANESRSFLAAKEGARVMALSLPCRYLHSPANVLDTRDLLPAKQLLEALAGELPVL